MAGEPSRGRLAGRCVLLVHEDAFQRGYLADVIGREGATVAGPAVSATDGIDRLSGHPAPVILVLSGGVADAAALIRAAKARQVAVLLVQRAGAPERRGAGRSLTAPFSGFQVVEAIEDLLRDRTMRSAGPHRRGH